ncbi:hypothetical protein [Melittangium boletus]|nr:hypothetical protein [Melittangium boletus]
MFVRMGVMLLMWALTACERGTGEPPQDGPPDSGTTPTGCFRPPSEAAKTPEWGFQFGTKKSEEFLDVALDAKGRLYLAGYENGDVGAARFDPSGDSRGVLFHMAHTADQVLLPHKDKIIDIPGTTETIDALVFHPDTGDLYFTGRTTGSFNPTHGAVAEFTHQGQQDFYVAGPHGSDREVILYQGGTSYPQHPNRLAFDAQGDLIVSGFDDFYVPSGTHYVERWEDPFVTKLKRSANGPALTQAWTKSFDTSYTDTLGGLAVDLQRDSGIYVTGNISAGPQRGAFVRKLDNTREGELGPVWRQSPISMDTIQAAQFLPDGNLLIAGATMGIMGEKSHGEQDVVLRLLNMNPEKGALGEILWTKQYGSPGADFVTDMTVDTQGHIIVVGETLDSVLEHDPLANKGQQDVFLMMFDKDGERLATRQWGSEGDDHPNAVAVDQCGEIFIVGYTTGDLQPPVPPYEKGERDAFLIASTMTRP